MPKRVDFSRVQFTTVIAEGESVAGTIDSKENIIVRGEVHGDIVTKKMVKIDLGGKVVGNIKANDAQVLGVLEGNLEVRNMLDLGGEGSISGRFTAKMMWAPQGYKVPDGSVVLKKNFPMLY